jgi:hypothetical protein
MISTFTIRLEVPADFATIPKCDDTPEYDGELDNILSVLSDLCELLGKAAGVRFVVGGFGQVDWGASVDRELCLLLVQLPRVAEGLARNDATFAIEFVEQGFWRILSFTGDDGELVVSCISGDAWTPSPDQTRISRRDLSAMLASLVETFCRIAGAACPGLVVHPWFTEWRESLSLLTKPPSGD